MSKVTASATTFDEDVVKYIANPTVVHRNMIDFLELAHQGKVQLVDCSNPTIHTMETTAILAAAAVGHTDAALAKQYPILSDNIEDLYRHMSYQDYFDRFSLPATVKFRVMLTMDSFLENAIADPSGLFKSIAIPMDTEINVQGTNYTMDNEVSIQMYQNNTIRVLYTKFLHESTMTDIILPSKIQKDVNSGAFIVFDMPVRQIKKDLTILDITKSVTFTKSIAYQDHFYKIKIYRTKPDGKRVRVHTTHTDQAYDPYEPTVVIKVRPDRADLYIPPIYTADGGMGSTISCILYSSKGKISEEYMLTNADDHKVTISDMIDELKDTHHGFNQCSYSIFPIEKAIGGRDPLTFPEVRNRFIQNNIGINNTPITRGHLDTKLSDLGFSLVEKVNSLTGRSYVATGELPHESKLPFKSPVGVGYVKMETSLNKLKLSPTVKDNGDQVTIGSNTLFEVNSGECTIVNNDYITWLKSRPKSEIVKKLNNKAMDYRFSPYHHVVDYLNGRLKLRTYQLDRPVTTQLDFYNKNSNVPLFISTGAVEIVLLKDRYQIKIQTRPDTSLNALPAGDFFAQMSWMVGNTRVHVDPTTIDKATDGTFLIKYDIKTNLKIDQQDRILVHVGDRTDVPLAIDGPIDMVFGQMRYGSTYMASDIDKLVSKDNVFPVTHEKFHIRWGTKLPYLWSDTRTMDDKVTHAVYDEDIPLRYDDTTIEVSNDRPVPFTIENGCEVKFRNATYKDQVVTDPKTGKVIYKHRKGETMRDASGRPMPVSIEQANFTLEMMTMEGSFYFATDGVVTKYLDEMSAFIIKQANEVMVGLNRRTLDHTTLFYKPYSTIGVSKIDPITGELGWIQKQQDLVINMDVEKTLLDDTDAVELLRKTSIAAMVGILKRQTISYRQVLSILSETYGDGVLGVTVKGLGGFTEPPTTLSLVNSDERLSLRKSLSVSNGDLLTIVDDIKVVPSAKNIAGYKYS